MAIKTKKKGTSDKQVRSGATSTSKVIKKSKLMKPKLVPKAARDSAPPDADADAGGDAPRRLGIRGAAPWAARHAAKHAAEARARAAEPPPPGSARATLREPTGAEEIKAKIGQLHNALVAIKNHRKNLSRHFYELGKVLREIRDSKLYQARGFGTFEAFLDRETDLGKTTGLRLVRIVEVFKRDAANEIGMERLTQVLHQLEAPPAVPHSVAAGGGGPIPMPMRPPGPSKR